MRTYRCMAPRLCADSCPAMSHGRLAQTMATFNCRASHLMSHYSCQLPSGPCMRRTEPSSVMLLNTISSEGPLPKDIRGRIKAQMRFNRLAKAAEEYNSLRVEYLAAERRIQVTEEEGELGYAIWQGQLRIKQYLWDELWYSEAWEWHFASKAFDQGYKFQLMDQIECEREQLQDELEKARDDLWECYESWLKKHLSKDEHYEMWGRLYGFIKMRYGDGMPPKFILPEFTYP